MGEARRRQTAAAAAVAVLYNGWLLDHCRMTPQNFTEVMDNYDRRWSGADREKLFAAAHFTGRTAKKQDQVMRHGAAMTLLWWLFRSGTYKGTHKSWCAERDLVVAFNDPGGTGKVKVDLWAGDRSLVEIEIDEASGRQIRAVESSDFPIYRGGDANRMPEELACFALGEEVLGILFRDRVDNDFGGVVLAPDDIGRFRMVDIAHSLPTPDAATQHLHTLMRTAAALQIKPAPL
jgi:hypothetical protein